MNKTILTNCRALTAGGLIDDATISVCDGRIDAITQGPHAGGASAADLGGRMLLPGFIDIQVNGGGGILFNDTPTVAGIEQIGRTHRRFGTTGFLPTLISDELDIVVEALDATRDAIEQRIPGVLGVHIEGPFLNHGRRGVHDERRLRRLTQQIVERLTPVEGGITLLTVAPEAVDPHTIRTLTTRGFIVCIGHSDASYEQARRALDQGVRGFTHLFNAMSQFNNREPGVVGAALDDDDSYCGIIVDGHHVSPVALRIAIRCKPPGTLMLVSDAMPSVGSDQRTFLLQGRTVTVENGVCKDVDGTLAGTHLDMASAVRNVMRLGGVELDAAVHMASRNPAAFLGCDRRRGTIAVGAAADLVAVDDNLNVTATWIEGQLLFEADAQTGRS